MKRVGDVNSQRQSWNHNKVATHMHNIHDLTRSKPTTIFYYLKIQSNIVTIIFTSVPESRQNIVIYIKMILQVSKQLQYSSWFFPPGEGW